MLHPSRNLRQPLLLQASVTIASVEVAAVAAVAAVVAVDVGAVTNVDWACRRSRRAAVLVQAHEVVVVPSITTAWTWTVT